MTRKLLAGRGWVKDAARSVVFFASLLGVFGAAGACGSAPPPVHEPDPYGPRIANCIITPRTLSDALQDRMVPIEGGAAVLGSTEAERAQARRDYGAGGQKLFRDEGRPRRAFIAAFKIDRTAVTHEAYREFVDACGAPPPNHDLITDGVWQSLRKRFSIPYTFEQIRGFLWDDHSPPPGREHHPLVLATHDEAGFYCAWRGARLPTEDEWERVARGRQGRIYPWGNQYDPFRVNNALRKVGDALPVGSLTQGVSIEGVLDLGGNVYEWTSSPWPGSKDLVVVKGNGFDGRGGYGRGAARLAFPRELRNVNLGFRCARNGD